jgi:hypothetical protein
VATTIRAKPYVALLVIRRGGRAEPWRLAFVGGYRAEEAAVAKPSVDADGYLAPTAVAPAVDPQGVHAALADYWRVAQRTGTVPPAAPFEPGIWTNELAATVAAHPQGTVDGGGLVRFVAYQTDPARDGVFVFAHVDGRKIACSVIRTQTTYIGTAPGSGPVQDDARTNWGPAVPPGLHGAVVVTAMRAPCIDVPPAGGSSLARVLGADEHVTATTYR